MFDILPLLTTAAGDVTAMATGAAPVVIGAVVAVGGVNIAIKFIKKFINKLG